MDTPPPAVRKNARRSPGALCAALFEASLVMFGLWCYHASQNHHGVIAPTLPRELSIVLSTVAAALLLIRAYETGRPMARISVEKRAGHQAGDDVPQRAAEPKSRATAKLTSGGYLVEIEGGGLAPGRRGNVHIAPLGRRHHSPLLAELICEEQVEHPSRHRWVERRLLQRLPLGIVAGNSPVSFPVELPDQAPCNSEAANRRVRWSVRLSLPREDRPQIAFDYPFTVAPDQEAKRTTPADAVRGVPESP